MLPSAAPNATMQPCNHTTFLVTGTNRHQPGVIGTLFFSTPPFPMNSEPKILKYGGTNPIRNLQKLLISNRIKAFQRNSKEFKAKYLTHLIQFPFSSRCGPPVKAGQTWSNQKRRGVAFSVLGFLWNLAVGIWNLPPAPHPFFTAAGSEGLRKFPS